MEGECGVRVSGREREKVRGEDREKKREKEE